MAGSSFSCGACVRLGVRSLSSPQMSVGNWTLLATEGKFRRIEPLV
jgi:hypothetical protein